MEVLEHVPLASLTTFKVGGNARYVVECRSEEDVVTAFAFIRERGLRWYVLGGGSNVLASDDGYEGVIIRPLIAGLSFEKKADHTCMVTVGAGVVWDELVQECVTRELWGLENLAAIPGLVGGAPVQNIGAYGADVSDTLIYVEAYNTNTNEIERLTSVECTFGYRDSLFKRDPSYIIVRVAFSLSTNAHPRIDYKDLAVYAENHTAPEHALTTPIAIAAAVREIRAHKFPDLRRIGTAGSFFKNPIISKEHFDTLRETYPNMPGFSTVDPSTSEEKIKVSLAWMLDHVLHAKGLAVGKARLFEQQPLVVVAETGATVKEINTLAQTIEEKVFDTTGIKIEREVRVL